MNEMHLKIPHRLPTPEHAVGKLKTITTGFKAAYAGQFVMEKEVWSVRECRFTLSIGKRRVDGLMRVHPSYVELICAGDLPRLALPRIERAVKSQLTRFLN